jgi:hypothetical protein
MTGHWPNPEVDHRNRNPADNRWCNLREVSHLVNHQNRSFPTRTKNNQTGRVGVSRTKQGTFRVQINSGGKNIGLGRYKTFQEAVAVREAAEIHYEARH